MSRPRRPASRAVVLLAAAAAACRGTEVASVNLDELLTPDNGFRYVAKIETGFRYFVHQFLDEDWFGDEGVLRAAERKPIADPSGVALNNLLTLRQGAYGIDAAWVDAEQVRQYARYAVICPSVLARERSLLELGAHAERLGLETPESEPEPGASPTEIRLGLEGLVEVLDRLVRAEGKIDDTARRDLASACDLLAGLELDIEGGWRLLKVVARFGLVTLVPRDELQPVLSLSEHVQRHLVGQALAVGRRDPAPRARAAAVRASVRAYGQPFLREALTVLARPGQVTPLFQLRAPAPDEEEVLVAILQEVRRRGLPLQAGASAADARRERLAMLFSLVQVAHDYTAYPDRARTAAMLALIRVSDSGLHTLREQDWAAWYRGYRERETAILEGGAEVEGGDGGR